MQIPCIERNAMGAIKPSTPPAWPCAATAHVVSLDKVIKTMMQTGADMKEIQGDLARRAGGECGGMLKQHRANHSWRANGRGAKPIGDGCCDAQLAHRSGEH